MGITSKIEWTESTWNPITGCSPVSEGCRNCYAKRMAYRLKGRYGYPAENPFRVTFHPDRLDQPLKWKKPRKIFVCSMGDLFHTNLRNSEIFCIFDQCQIAHQHTYIFLTKRPERALRTIRLYINDWNIKQLPGNFWFGVTTEDQKTADERIPILLQIPAAVRFVSIEPILEHVDLDQTCKFNSCWRAELDWVIIGQETGPGARPAKAEWFNSIIGQCKDVGVPVFVKKAPAGVEMIREHPNIMRSDIWG